MQTEHDHTPNGTGNTAPTSGRGDDAVRQPQPSTLPVLTAERLSEIEARWKAANDRALADVEAVFAALDDHPTLIASHRALEAERDEAIREVKSLTKERVALEETVRALTAVLEAHANYWRQAIWPRDFTPLRDQLLAAIETGRAAISPSEGAESKGEAVKRGVLFEGVLSAARTEPHVPIMCQCPSLCRQDLKRPLAVHTTWATEAANGFSFPMNILEDTLEHLNGKWVRVSIEVAGADPSTSSTGEHGA